MDAILVVVEKVGILFVMVAVGYVCTKMGVLTEKGTSEITSLILWIVTPCLIISSFLSADSGVNMTTLGISALTAALAHVIPIALSLCLFRKADPARRKTMRFALIFSNAGFMGVPLVQSVVGNSGVVYASMFITVFNLVTWTYGYSMMSGETHINWKTAIINPGVIGLTVGLPLYLFKVQLPPIVQEPIQSFAALNSPLAMAVVGSYIARISFKDFMTDPDVYKVSFARLVVAPLIFLGCMALIRPEHDLLVGNVIQAAAPVAANAVLFSVQFGHDARFASKTVAFSTLFSILSLPLFAAAAELLAR